MFLINFPFLSYPNRPRLIISIGYIKPRVKPSQSNVLSSYLQIIRFYESNTLPMKKLNLQGKTFKVRQHGQQQLFLQYKVCWIFCKIVGAHPFSQPYLCVKPHLQSPPKICFSTSFKFHLPIQVFVLPSS